MIIGQPLTKATVQLNVVNTGLLCSKAGKKNVIYVFIHFYYGHSEMKERQGKKGVSGKMNFFLFWGPSNNKKKLHVNFPDKFFSISWLCCLHNTSVQSSSKTVTVHSVSHFSLVLFTPLFLDPRSLKLLQPTVYTFYLRMFKMSLSDTFSFLAILWVIHLFF